MLCCSLLIATVTPQTLKAIIDRTRIETQAGNTDVVVQCRFTSPLVACHFDIPGVEKSIKLGEGFSTDPRFEYVGGDGGRKNGFCGIKILKVTEEMHGTGTCRLDPDGGTDAVANFEIVISRAPTDPVIHIIDPTGRLVAGQRVTATCVAEDARPAGKKVKIALKIEIN